MNPKEFKKPERKEFKASNVGTYKDSYDSGYNQCWDDREAWLKKFLEKKADEFIYGYTRKEIVEMINFAQAMGFDPKEK